LTRPVQVDVCLRGQELRPPTDYFEKKDARKYDLFAQFALIAAKEAITDAV
jgi:3-oxoacyl-(acyl-carrier-protein) synthase